MSTALFLARRISLRSRGGARAGVIIAVTGIALALTVMMLSVAVMQGFKKEIAAKVTGFESQLTVTADNGEGNVESDLSTDIVPVALTPRLREIIAETLHGVTVNVVATRPGVLKTPGDFSGVVFRGYDADFDHSFLASNITEGTLPRWSAGGAADSIVISRLTASRLGLAPGDKTGAYFFSNGALKARSFTVAAIYDSHFSDYDAVNVFASLPAIARIDRLPEGAGSRIDINGIADDAMIEPAASQLQDALLHAYYEGRLTDVYRVDNIHRSGALYFNWLELLDTNVIVILILMAAVSAFTLISSLFIIILERVNMIGVLKALGASNRLIRHTFIIVAERLVIRGLIIGNAVALTLILLQSHTHFIPLDADSYYLSYVPVSIGWMPVVALNAGVILMSALVLLLPSAIVARISPSRSIRFD